MIEACAGVETCGIVEDVEQNVLVLLIGQPEVMAGIVLPEGSKVLNLPPAHGLGRRFVAGVGSQVVFESPAANASAVGFEVASAKEFAGSSAVGGRRFGGKELAQQIGDLWRPVWGMISSGTARFPRFRKTAGAGFKKLTIELVKPGMGKAQFRGGGGHRNLFGTEERKDVTDEWCGDSVD